MHRLILWDIDGTLVHSPGIGTRVFDEAFEAVVGRVPPNRFSFGGMTDPGIVHEHLDDMELDRAHAPVILRHIETGLAARADELAATGSTYPGVVDILGRVADVPGVTSSVLNGNLAANARVKLAAFGLDSFLDLEVGAYGSDSADRDVLVDVARARLVERRHITVEPDDIWVVGDTPRDAQCARAAGARCLLVATGKFDADELHGLGAEAVLADLSETERVASMLLGAGPANRGGSKGGSRAGPAPFGG